ncbi:MAG: dnaX 2, partial [Marmoricola sp.]|nr:dnaX 2 [Marmoricola sp.]
VALANASSPEWSLGRIEAIFEAREQMLEFNVPPLLALESMMVALRMHRV